jgi:hypothetical protein
MSTYEIKSGSVKFKAGDSPRHTALDRRCVTFVERGGKHCSFAVCKHCRPIQVTCTRDEGENGAYVSRVTSQVRSMLGGEKHTIKLGNHEFMANYDPPRQSHGRMEFFSTANEHCLLIACKRCRITVSREEFVDPNADMRKAWSEMWNS